MATATLTIQVSEEAARAFAQVTPEDRRKIQLLLDLRLRDYSTASAKIPSVNHGRDRQERRRARADTGHFGVAAG